VPMDESHLHLPPEKMFKFVEGGRVTPASFNLAIEKGGKNEKPAFTKHGIWCKRRAPSQGWPLRRYKQGIPPCFFFLLSGENKKRGGR